MKESTKQINILILSVGTRNMIIRYFKRELMDAGNVIAADMSELAPAIYEADKYYIVPGITDKQYIETILAICKKERVSAVLSLIDPELALLAENEDKFKRMGVTIVGSSANLCELCLNKWLMYNWLQTNGYKCAKTFMEKDAFYKAIDAGEIRYPVFVKPICGSASVSVSKVYDKETVETLFNHGDNLLIQEYLNGQEIGADVYIDMISHDVVSIFTKKKLVMRAGETDKAVSFKDRKLFDLIERFVLDMGFTGQVDIDLFEINGEYYISEVNPRFGGGYPHAYECGCNHMKLIRNNLQGKINDKQIGCYEEGVFMMKFSDVKLLENNSAVSER